MEIRAMASYSGFWGDGANSTGNYAMLSKRSPNRYHLMRILRKRGMQEYGEILTTLLTDSSPSTSASYSVGKIDAVRDTGASNSQGGVRNVSTVEQVGGVLDSTESDTAATARAVTSADVTTMQAEIGSGATANRAPTSYPDDASGNGGGGKLS